MKQRGLNGRREQQALDGISFAYSIYVDPDLWQRLSGSTIRTVGFNCANRCVCHVANEARDIHAPQRFYIEGTSGPSRSDYAPYGTARIFDINMEDKSVDPEIRESPTVQMRADHDKRAIVLSSEGR
jgi:hypothetical protein